VGVQEIDYQYVGMPDTVPAGLVAVTSTNGGSQPHQIILGQLKVGVTDQQVVGAFPGRDAKIDPLLDYAGGPNLVAPGGSQTVVVNLPPGRYVALCFVPTADGTTHFMKGMYHFFTVAKTSASVLRGQLTATGTFGLRDFAFATPLGGVPSGQTTIKVVNQGAQPHELVLVHLAAGKTVQDMITWVHASAPLSAAPFTPAGGMGVIAPGTTSWMLLNLRPGEYVAYCYVLDPATGKRHVNLGMISPFTVH
jgi:hypothetical protein